MTTNVTILNNGPQDVKVTAINNGTQSTDEQVLKPGQFLGHKYVYNGQELKIEELPVEVK